MFLKNNHVFLKKVDIFQFFCERNQRQKRDFVKRFLKIYENIFLPNLSFFVQNIFRFLFNRLEITFLLRVIFWKKCVKIMFLKNNHVFF